MVRERPGTRWRNPVARSGPPADGRPDSGPQGRLRDGLWGADQLPRRVWARRPAFGAGDLGRPQAHRTGAGSGPAGRPAAARRMARATAASVLPRGPDRPPAVVWFAAGSWHNTAENLRLWRARRNERGGVTAEGPSWLAAGDAFLRRLTISHNPRFGGWRSRFERRRRFYRCTRSEPSRGEVTSSQRPGCGVVAVRI